MHTNVDYLKDDIKNWEKLSHEYLKDTYENLKKRVLAVREKERRHTEKTLSIMSILLEKIFITFNILIGYTLFLNLTRSLFLLSGSDFNKILTVKSTFYIVILLNNSLSI